MHIRIIVKREKIERYPNLLYKLSQLSQSITWTSDFLLLIPTGEYEEITTLLESQLICYGIESDIEIFSSDRKVEREKGA